MPDKSIAVQILSGDLNGASESIREELSKLGLEALSLEKEALAKALFTEDFDAAPKGKTDFDASKEDEDEEDEEENDADEDEEDEEENDADEDEEKSDSDDDDKDGGGDTEIDIKVKKDGKVEQN